MYNKPIFVLLIALLSTLSLKAQDTLPKFSAVNKGNDRVIISWTNPWRDTIRQLSVQRSFDSLKNFKTILTLPDPTVPQNGYVDAQAPSPRMFYRLYILLDNGKFLFSKSKRAAADNAANPGQLVNPVAGGPKTADLTSEQLKILDRSPSRIIYIKVKETFLMQIPETSLRQFRDSIRSHTRDTLTLIPPDTILIKPFVPVEVFKASRYVYTEKEGNVRIFLPDAARHKYAVKFFEEDGSLLFEMKQVKDPVLILDKVNFNHAGWFLFELYENGALKEKSKFFVPKDF